MIFAFLFPVNTNFGFFISVTINTENPTQFFTVIKSQEKWSNILFWMFLHTKKSIATFNTNTSTLGKRNIIKYIKLMDDYERTEDFFKSCLARGS
jgi:hypothetical protein